jgi:hypothetical protein
VNPLRQRIEAEWRAAEAGTEKVDLRKPVEKVEESAFEQANPFEEFERVVDAAVKQRVEAIAAPKVVQETVSTEELVSRLAEARREVAEIDKMKERRTELNKLIDVTQNLLAERRRVDKTAVLSGTQISEIETLNAEITSLRKKGARANFPVLSADDAATIPQRDHHLHQLRRFKKMLKQSLDVLESKQRKFQKEKGRVEKLASVMAENEALRRQLLKLDEANFPLRSTLPGPDTGRTSPSVQATTSNEQ